MVPEIDSPLLVFASTVNVPPFAAAVSVTVPLPVTCPPRTVLIAVRCAGPFTATENITLDPSAGFHTVNWTDRSPLSWRTDQSCAGML